eukprot:81964_1
MAVNTTLGPSSCVEQGCTMHYAFHAQCQCYYSCRKFKDCCDDFVKVCEGMSGVETEEKEALSDVAAFSVFYSILIFIFLLMIFVWASFNLFSFCKKHSKRSQLTPLILQ